MLSEVESLLGVRQGERVKLFVARTRSGTAVVKTVVATDAPSVATVIDTSLLARNVPAGRATTQKLRRPRVVVGI